MVDHVATVQTQSVQLWMSKNLKELGMDVEKMGLPKDTEPITDTYQNPLNSWADMSGLVHWEDWPDDNKPRHISYFCGPLRDESQIPPYSDSQFPQRQTERVKYMTEQWLNDNGGFLWPNATVLPEAPQGLNLDLLVHPEHKHASSIEKFEAQYFKANIDPSERYVLSLPGTARYRFKAHETPQDQGYENLFFTGDWINNGLNMGCVEATVVSGLLTTKAVRDTYGLYTQEHIHFHVTGLPPSV